MSKDISLKLSVQNMTIYDNSLSSDAKREFHILRKVRAYISEQITVK